MLNWFKRSETVQSVPEALFLSISDRSRSPVFYEQLSFEDNVTGRFDVLALHMMLVNQHLGAKNDEKLNMLSQDVFDLFVGNLDDALRQLGIGDTSVPKKKKRLVHTFYGHVDAFDKPLKDNSLPAIEAAALERFGPAIKARDASALAMYLQDCVSHIAQIGGQEFLAGNLSWPELEISK